VTTTIAMLLGGRCNRSAIAAIRACWNLGDCAVASGIPCTVIVTESLVTLAIRVGFAVGAPVGPMVGLTVAPEVGLTVAIAVEMMVGGCVGCDVVRPAVGGCVGCCVGIAVGAAEITGRGLTGPLLDTVYPWQVMTME
jgi:hypothetical protein